MADFFDRLRQIIELENISINKFEDSIGCSRGVIAKALRNKSDISTKWVISIREKYPQYSMDWLLVGEGDISKPAPAPNNAALIDFLNDKLEKYEKKIESLIAKNAVLQVEVESLKKPFADSRTHAPLEDSSTNLPPQSPFVRRAKTE